jgi:outer membrane protein assembly factor BamB
MRNLDRIAILSQQTEKVIWDWGSGELDNQHHATFLDNGNILLFDNGPSRGFSRVIELNPLLRKIDWEYKAHPPENFFSTTRGACQRLPNGNTLITDSNNGRVFEITRNGEMVWEFFMPTLSKKDDILRPTIYRMTRITDGKGFF